MMMMIYNKNFLGADVLYKSVFDTKSMIIYNHIYKYIYIWIHVLHVRSINFCIADFFLFFFLKKLSGLLENTK